MVRAPCCEKMGLKRGPWTPDEDQVLISYIQRYGHGNWRALPKQAGLLRCGKSCRLRWTNYLRPDIKRGNFTREEEDTIIKLHQMLGNRWSAIAARLPGRTDNEIKNVWHTHLKKKLKQNLTASDTKRKGSIGLSKCEPSMGRETKPRSKSKSKSKSNSHSNSNLTNLSTPQTFEEPGYIPLSPPQSSSEFSNGTESISTSEKDNKVIKEEYLDSWDTMPHFDENLWSQVMPMESFNTPNEFSTTKIESRLQFPFSSTSPNYCSNMDDSMDFWYDVFTKAEEFPELPEF